MTYLPKGVWLDEKQREKIRKLKRENPELSYVILGKRFGVSFQTIATIIQKEEKKDDKQSRAASAGN